MKQKPMKGPEAILKENPRIAVVKLGSIGDCIHMLPVMRALRRNFPKAALVWVVEEKSREIPTGQDGIDEVMVVDTRGWRSLLKSGRVISAFRAVRSFQKRCSERRFDWAIDGQGLIKSGLITWLTGAPIRVGFAREDCREGLNTLFTNRRIHPGAEHVVERNLSLLEGVGAPDRSVSFDFTLPPEAVERIDSWLQSKGLI
ncbi:MAG TPA: glycosyltransferase family 9 protein, partial [Candidatus Manganitrophaceae bacterium]